ncbi:S-layer homology domain-containing protein [Ureibacillus manganicus]|uniref:SLH domain-containing protein n=1 Tax=Ureibacillus manganicus DSM 26584 TaxID=1384049 RepID=A0A0A3I5Q1_9BACL|nr:S-layer homology domain-containing protein [Ureibacillus manganicus]KGR80131.1 hypothetical protein CD29_01870 [Ureibacillus manganicus DSM 26584]
MAKQNKGRKLFATTATAALVASALVPAAAFAADTKEFTDASKISDYAKKSVDYLVGKGAIAGFDGKFNPKGELTRAEAVTILVKAKGIAIDENKKTDFADAKDHWASEEIAALQAHNKDIIAGFEDGTFRPDDKITRAQLALIIVKAYDLKQDTSAILNFTDNTATWSKDAVNTLASLGIVAGVSETKFDPTAVVTREQAAAFFHRTEVKEERIAVKTSVPVVTSVSATNLKEVVISFNKELSDAKIKADQFSVKDNTVAAVTLSDDKKSVTLTLGTAVAQQATVEVTAKTTVAFADESALAEDVVKSLTVTDVIIPVAESITLTGPNTFEIKFSEPVQAGASADVSVNNGVYGIAQKTLSTDGRTLTVQLSAGSIAEATYKVKVEGYSDFAPFAAMAKTFDLVYVKDKTAPTVKLVSASQNEVVVEFDKAVTKKGGAALDVNYFYQTYSAWKPVAVTTTDNKKFTLKFSDNDPATQDFILPEGNVPVTVLKSVGDVPVVDLWGNELAADAKLTATITADKVAPTVTKVEAKAENQLVVTFSEKVNVAANNFTIKDVDGKVVSPTISNVAFDNDKLTATIDLSAKLAGGNYTVEVKDVTDTSLSANKILPVTLSVSVTDKTPMNLSEATATVVDNATAKEQYIYVTFPEAIDAKTALNKDLYLVNGTALASNDKIELFGTNNKRVKITVKYRGATPAAVVVPGTDVATDDLTFGRIADASGNLPTALSTTINITDETAPTTFTAKAIGLNKLQLVFNGELKTVVADGIEIDGNGDDTYATAAAIDNVEIKDGKTYVTVTTKAAEASVNKSAIERNKIQVKVVDNKLETITGQKLTNVAAVTKTNVADGIAPELESTDPVTLARTSATVATITVDFDEALDTLDALAATDLVVKDANGKEYVAGTNYSVALNAGDDSKLEIVITFADEATLDKLNNTKFSVATKTTVNYLDDAAGNKVKVFETKQTKTALADNPAQ